jgi:glycosyltransferase involved in cell wall biosynthesis
MRIVYLVNVDWFFVSHFLHLARRARDVGDEVSIATHLERSEGVLREAGLDVVALPARRGGVLPRGLGDAAEVVASELRRDPDAILHGFGLFGIAVGAMARRRSGAGRNVYTITGRGYSAIAPTLKARLVRTGTAGLCRRLADGPRTRWIAENEADLAACGLAHATREGRTAIVGGAGIDPQQFAPTPLPPRPPLRCALVARMIWSKGIDIAVEAVERARAAGVDVELTLVGGIDPANPQSLREADLRALAERSGIRWLGRSDDIASVWREHHLAVLPSRGGEGLPKSLIEAAASGRAILTSDVPGCREFAAATHGWSVPAGDARALADRLVAIAADDSLAARGRHAAEVARTGYTEAQAWQVVRRFYDELAGKR